MKRTPLKRKTGLKRGTKRLAKVRKDTVGKLKKKLWAITRQIVLKRYGSQCYTCPSNPSGSGLHVGHYIPSSVCSAELRYDLGNLRPQCFRCNIHLSGNWPAYEAHLIRDGIDVDALKRRNQETKGMKADVLFYQRMIDDYTNLLAQL